VSKPTGCYPSLTVDTSAKRVVSQAGAVLLVATAGKVGLDRALSDALAPWRKQWSVLDPDKILLDLAVSVAIGGDCLADVGLLRAEPEHDLHRGLHDPVTHRRNRQRTQLPTAGLGYEHPTRRRRAPSADLQIRDQLIQQPGHPVLLDIGDARPVDTGRAAIAAHINPRPLQDVPAIDLVAKARGTFARDRPWPPGKAHAARHEPGPSQTPKRRN